MEVHHHSHAHGKKNWKNYFWEFLMLFLAVFCGFLAEYQLEHVIEHQREKKYAISLYDDLTRDVNDLNADIQWWQNHISRADTILQEFDKPEKERNLVGLYRCFSFMRRYNAFEYHDRTIDQLKNAGFFRLFRKKNVADSLMEYDSQVRRTLFNIEEGGDRLYYNLNFLLNEIIDTRYFPTIVENFNLDSLSRARQDVFFIKENNKEKLFEFDNHLRYYRGNMILRITVMRGLLRNANNLVEMIRKEYHLK